MNSLRENGRRPPFLRTGENRGFRCPPPRAMDGPTGGKGDPRRPGGGTPGAPGGSRSAIRSMVGGRGRGRRRRRGLLAVFGPQVGEPLDDVIEHRRQEDAEK